MNRSHVLIQLREAAEELQRTTTEIEEDPDYAVGDLTPAMQHLYHHLNTAWNAQTATEAEVAECSATNFEKWRQFPSDTDLSA